ncbi:MAG: hypothetical protein KAT66_03245 [Candidatus Lokiarchaeota archaeon]|nr:hypothetical protein [Candidatus Lokiarchaeota archaeon]
MGSQTVKKDTQDISEKLERPLESAIQIINNSDKNLEDIIDENLITLKKVHSILLNCINLTKKQKLEFAESERYFMKKYLKKLTEKIKNSEKKTKV